MPKIYDVIQSLNKLIENYPKLKKYARQRAKQLSIKKYVKSHLNIINNLC